MKNTSIRIVVISGALAVIGILLVQSYWVRQAYSLAQKSFDEKAQIALRQVAQDLSALTQVQLPAYDLIRQVAKNYYVVNIRESIQPRDLEFYLIKAFEKVSLPPIFEYGIYDCSSDEMVYGGFVNQLDRQENPLESIADLEKHAEFVYYFGVRFPKQDTYLFQDIWLSLVFSGILLLAIGFFIFSTYTILKQKRLSELQKDFINNMTHEFKTPISSIQLAAKSLLKPEKLGLEKAKIYAGIIDQQSQRLNEHVEQVLNTARIQKMGIKLNLQRVSFQDTLEEVVDQMHTKIKDRNGTVHWKGLDGLSTMADDFHLKNIFENIIDNALKYNQKSPILNIQGERQPQCWTIDFQDNGLGLKTEQLKKIFRKFYRVHTGNVHDVKGFGLGLFYVKQACEAHGWQILASSEYGKGSCFTIKIPAHG